MANKYSDDFKDKFIDVYLKNFSVTKSCKAMNVDRKTFYAWKADDKIFAKKFQDAVFERIDILNEENEQVHRIMRLGIPKKDKKGSLVGWKERPDTRAIEWHLTKNHPDYGDKLTVKVEKQVFKIGDQEIEF